MLPNCNTPCSAKLACHLGMLVLACATTSPAEPPVPQQVSDAVDAHIERLSSDILAERTAAEQALIDIGPDLLDLLPPLDLVENPAARDALARIRNRVEIEAAQQSITPTHVSLAGTYSVEQIAREIFDQTRNPISADALPEPLRQQQLDVAYEQTTFWETVNDLTEQLNLSWRIEQDTLAFVPLEEPPTSRKPIATTVSGAFRIELHSLTPKKSTLRAQFSIIGEPRLRPLFLSVADADFHATQAKNELKLFNPNARTELPMTSRAPTSFAVIFTGIDPEHPATTISLKGRVKIHAAALPREIRFRGLTTGERISRRRGGVTVTLTRGRFTETRAGDRAARIRLAVAYDTGGPAFESHRTWLYHNEVYLESPDGRRFPVNDGFDTTAQADGGAALEYRFNNLPDIPIDNWELVYVAPTLLIDLPVTFDFPARESIGDQTQ